MVTYWMELRTGCIYKYEFGTKPYNYKTDWKQVTCHEYTQVLVVAARKYLHI